MSKSTKITVDDLDNAPTDEPIKSTTVTIDEYEKLSKRHIEVVEQLDRVSTENRDMRDNLATSAILDDLIRPFAYATFVFMMIYCFFVAVLILEQAYGDFKRPLSDSVVEILVGSTAVTVIGLVGMVLTGVFVGARKKK